MNQVQPKRGAGKYRMTADERRIVRWIGMLRRRELSKERQSESREWKCYWSNRNEILGELIISMKGGEHRKSGGHRGKG